jgi:drug/metabolite transporter (DMT)-like permease
MMYHFTIVTARPQYMINGGYIMKKYAGELFLAAGFMLAGTSVVAAHWVSGKIGTFTIVAVSLFFAILSLLPLTFGKIRFNIKHTTRKMWLLAFLQALFGIFMFRYLLLLGLNYTSAGEAGLLTGVAPAATAVIAIVWLREKPGLLGLAGLLSTVTGMTLIQGAVLLGGNGLSATHFCGNLMVIGAAFSESLFNILSRFSSLKTARDTKREFNPLMQTMLVAIIAFILCLVPSFFEHPVSTLLSLDMNGWLALIWYGAFVTSLSYVCWYAGIKRCDASSAAAFSGLMPFSSLLFSILILGEHPEWLQWAGGFMIMFGMLLTGYRKSTATTTA